MDIAISVEETNQLRAKIGLPPITTKTKDTEKPSNNTVTRNSNGNGHSSYNDSLSIEETNKLRAKIGLPLIVTDDEIPNENGTNDEEVEQYNNTLKLNESRSKDDKLTALKLRLDKTKSDLKKTQFIHGGTLIDRMGDEAEDTDEDWLKKIGEKKKPVKKKEDVQEPTEANGDEFENLSIKHDLNAFNSLISKSGNGKEVVLTLKDKSIYDDDISEDELENVELNETLKVQESLKEKIKAKKVNTADEFVGLGDDLDEVEIDIKEGSFQLNKGIVPSQRQHGEKDEPTISTTKKRKLVVFDVEDDEYSDAELASDYVKTKKPKKIKKLKIKTDSKRTKDKEDRDFEHFELINEDLEQEDNSELNDFLSITRRKGQSKKKREISDLLDNEHEQDLEEKEEQMRLRNGEADRLIIDEGMEFLTNIKAEGEVSDEEKSSEVQRDLQVSEDANPEQKIEESKLASILSDTQRGGQANSYGLSATLKLLKERSAGQTPQALNPDISNKVNGTYDPKINLVYTDDDGKVLGTKEAYKYLSHKFHGHKK